MGRVYSLNEIKERLTPVFDRYHVKGAMLFGSYAKGNACSYSDIDILVDSGLKGLAFYGLLGEVADCLEKDVDLIDTTQIIKGSEIMQEIERTGILIYGKEATGNLIKDVEACS